MAPSFTCPHCEAITGQQWKQAVNPTGGDTLYAVSICMAHDCNRFAIWIGSHDTMVGGFGSPATFGKNVRIVWPHVRRGPEPNEDLNVDIKKDYQEAREVLSASPRAAAALLRLALQKLMVQLGQTGQHVNDDIAALVRDGLRRSVQQAADVVRVTGNDAVHPGQIDTDNPETVLALFELVNIIADDRISQPARITAMYESLPDEKKDAIEKRDGSSS